MRFTLVSSWQEGASDNLPHECTAVSLVDAFWQHHGASRLVVLFGLVWGRELEELQRSEEDLHSAFARIVERAAIARLRSVLPVFMSRFAEDPDDPGANPPGRKIRFTAQCRVNYSGAEKEAFGPRADWVKLKTAVRSGLERATSWVLEPRAAAAEVNATVFFAADHVAFGVEVKELEMRPALPFSWSRLARPGMQTQIAGAMAAVAAECMIDAEIEGTQPSIVVDPTCGMGTLLLAAARIWPQVSQRPLRLVGRETSSSQLQKCLSNFAACCVDASDIRMGDGRDASAFADIADASADALICDLPSGAAHKASSDKESYMAFLRLAERILRPGGRCVLLSNRQQLLSRCAQSGPWKEVCSWVMGRGEANMLKFLLLVLEREATPPTPVPGKSPSVTGVCVARWQRCSCPMLPYADENVSRELQPVETVEMCRGQCGALASACRNKDFAAARALIEQGVDVAEKEPRLDSDNFNAAIHWAVPAWNGSHSLVTDLLGARASVHQANQEGLQAVHLATRNGRLSTLAVLWRHENGVVAARDAEGGTAAHHAANCGFIHILEWLYLKGASMKSADSYGLTPLHCAVMAGKVLATQMLLRRGADALAVDVKRRTPLHWAAVHGRGALVESVYGIDRRALGGPAAFDIQDYQGKRPQDLTRRMDICMMAHLTHAKAWHGRANRGCFLRCLTELMPRQPTTLFMVFLTPCLHIQLAAWRAVWQISCSAILNAMSRRKPRLCAIAVSSLPFLGLTRLFVTKLPWTQKDGHSGHAGLAHRAVAQDVVEDVVEVVEELAPPVDLKKTPWEALDVAFQAEGKRCWGPGFDGKVPGYIAECLRRENPASSDEPPFRRRWLKRREEESDEAPDPYATLGVDPNATLKEIRKAYIRLAKETHPDTGGDAVAFQDVLLAYRILSDEERRKEYDQTGEDAGDAPAEERKVRVSDLATLRSAIENHREVRWERGMANLAGQTGTVQFDDPDTGLTEVVIWISAEDGFSAWLPSEVLTYLNPDGEEQPYEFYQQALMRLNKGAIVKIEPYEKQMSRIIEYTLGWQSHDSGAMQKPDPLRDAAFAQVFFKKGREAEDRGVVLDIGCGTGDGSRLFATSRKFDLVFGLDTNSTALGQARQESEDEEIGPEQGLFLLRADAQELPFRDQQVDYVWWSFGWSEVERPEDVLKGIYRVLKVGGRVVIATGSGKPLAKEIQSKLSEAGFAETSIYPPRSRVFLNYAAKLH
ncbi:secG [Symbiodinium sp. KB8]|nr:secG [Symbiodinium sp. KB8]